MIARRLIHGLGYRYRLHSKDLPGKPDLVFRSRSKVIFVHGCFWHRHPDPSCRLARTPKSRHDFWGSKLRTNSARDLVVLEQLKNMNWHVMIVWECELRDVEGLTRRIQEFLGE